MTERPMTTADKPPLEIHAFEKDGFQAARLGLGDENAVRDSGPGRLRLARREIEDDEAFLRVASDLQFGLERNGFLPLRGDRKLEDGVARRLRGRRYLGSRPPLGVREERNLIEPIGVLAVVSREHELHLGNDDAVCTPFQPEALGDGVAQVLGLGLAVRIAEFAAKIHALQHARRRPADFAAWS